MTRRLPIACLTLVCTLAVQRTGEAADWGWLEKLSGPGPFGAPVPGFNFPLACIREDGRRDLFFCNKFDVPPDKPIPDPDKSNPDKPKPSPDKTRRGRDDPRRNPDVPPPPQPTPEAPPPPKVRAFLGVEIQRWSSHENILFPDNRRDARTTVRIFDLRPNLMIPVHDAVDVGISVGFHWFSGDSFDTFFKTSLEPVRTSIAPLVIFRKKDSYSNRGALRALRFEAAIVRFRGEFTDEDFCTPGKCEFQRTDFLAEGEYQWRSALVIDLSSVLWGR